MLEFMRITATHVGERVRVLLADMRGLGTTDDEDNAEHASSVEVVQPFGLLTRPTIAATLEAVVARLGDELVAFGLLDKGTAAIDPTPEEGETRLYALSGAYLRERADGSMDLVTASGKAIRLGASGGTADKPVAHEGSGTAGHSHTAGAYVAGPYSVTGTSASATDSIATGQGSANVLVPDT